MDNVVNVLSLQVCMQVCTRRSLNTMVRPQHLFSAMQLNHVTDRFTVMLAGEASVVCRVPVLCGEDHVEVGHQPIGNCDDVITVRDGECPAGHEIILQVNKDQRFHGFPQISKLKPCFVSRSYF